MQTNSGASSSGDAHEPTDDNVTKAVLVVTTAILAVALIFLAYIYYANRPAAGQDTTDQTATSDFETPEYARKTFAYQIPSVAATNIYNNNKYSHGNSNIGNNSSSNNSSNNSNSTNSNSNTSNNTRKPSSGRLKTKSEDNKTNSNSARSMATTSYNNALGKSTTTTAKTNNNYNNINNSSILATKSNHKAAKNTGNKLPLSGRLWRSGKPGETDHMAGHYRNHAVLQEFYSPIDTDERPTFRRNLFADEDDGGIGARGLRSRSGMKSGGSKAGVGGGVAEFSSSDTPSRYINQSTESPITTASSNKNRKINSVDNSPGTGNFDSSSSSSKRSGSREKSTVKKIGSGSISNEVRSAERDRYELLMADAREESADTSIWALELMKKAVTTPAVLIGCGVLVDGYGLGRVVGLQKRPFQATLVCVEVTSTGQVVNLDLLRKSSENDDTKGSIPFKIIQKP